MKTFVDGLKSIIPDHPKVDEFIKYFKERYLGEGPFGYRNFDYFKSIQDDYTDLTNNMSESLNHALNTVVARGTSTLPQICQTMYDRKVHFVGKLVESCLNEESMEKRSEEFMAKRTLLRQSIQRFSQMSQDEQKRGLIRYFYAKFFSVSLQIFFLVF